MKKYIISESQYKRIIKENGLKNQSEIDKILDKINKYGKESLTWHEKHILDNPDDEEFMFEGNEEIEKLASQLITNKLVDADLINVYEDHIEIYSINGYGRDFFDEYEGIILMTVQDEVIYVQFLFDDEDEMYDTDRILNYMRRKWSKILKKNIVEGNFID